MKKVMSACLLVFAVTSLAGAVPPGKKLTFDTPNGKVTFDGTTHKTYKCSHCHPSIFQMKFGADKMAMKDIFQGKYCGVCHNGHEAFSATGNCNKCHK